MSDAPAAGDSQFVPPGDSNLDNADKFFANALERIRRISVVLGAIATIAVGFRFGIAIAIGFVVGCAASYVNFLWLERVINEVANRMERADTETEKERKKAGSAKRVVLRFFFRYVLVAIACFVILICFKSSVYGFLGGLFLTVAAILCEAAYEAATALRREG